MPSYVPQAMSHTDQHARMDWYAWSPLLKVYTACLVLQAMHSIAKFDDGGQSQSVADRSHRVRCT